MASLNSPQLSAEHGVVLPGRGGPAGLDHGFCEGQRAFVVAHLGEDSGKSSDGIEVVGLLSEDQRKQCSALGG